MSRSRSRVWRVGKWAGVVVTVLVLASWAFSLTLSGRPAEGCIYQSAREGPDFMLHGGTYFEIRLMRGGILGAHCRSRSDTDGGAQLQFISARNQTISSSGRYGLVVPAWTVRNVPEYRFLRDSLFISRHSPRETSPVATSVQHLVFVPFWIAALPIAIVTVVAWWRGRRVSPGHCRRCGYDLTKNESGICPECGVEIARRTPADGMNSASGESSAAPPGRSDI